MIHATNTIGGGGGGKSARDGDLQCKWRGWGSLSVPRSSDVPVESAVLQEYGVVTSPSPGPGGGGSPRRVSGERESSLADPHGGPAATGIYKI